MTTTGAEIEEMPDEQDAYEANPLDGDEAKWGALRMIGLLALLAAFGGFVYLAYMQGVRNGAVGAPPVITADAGPYKVRPQSPGGETFPNQDKIIYDRVEGTDTASAGAKGPTSQIASAAGSSSHSASGDDLVTHEPAPLVVAEAPPEASPSAKSPTLAPSSAGSSASAKPAPATTDTKADGIAAAIAKADGNGEGGPINPADEISPKETDHPSVSATAKAASNQVAEAAKPASQGVGETGATGKASTAPTASAAAATSGAYVVQIASYRDRSEAESAWKKFNQKFGDLSSNLSPDYQSADVPGKGAYVRLRVGPFDTKDAANNLCEQLKSRSQGCLVVKG